MRKTTLSLVLFVLSISSYSQKFSIDTNYVERFRNKIIVVLYNSVQQNSLDLSRQTHPDSTEAIPLSYPTVRASFGLTLSYKFVTFSVGTNAFNFIMRDYIDEREHKIGKTSVRNFAFTWNPNRFRIEMYYRSITGFHEDNRATYDPTFGPNSVYEQFPKMQTVSYGADILWTFNARKRFSIGAPYSYTTRQKKSAGSFLMYFGVNQFSLTSPTSFIPELISSQYGPYQDLKRFDGTCISWGAGYAYTIVIGKIFFINLTATGRYPFMWKRFETESGLVKEDFSEPEDPALINFAVGRGAVGINFKRFFASAYVYADMYNYKYFVKKSQEIGIINKNIRGAVVLGMRFNKPKKKSTRSSID
ncbi:MAG: DUF4421 family protein [Flavobacteriales bacterium]